MRKIVYLYALVTACIIWSKINYAQITAPPSGDNQKASVTQYMGLVGVTINYNSPNVHAPDGTDRRGHIWGDLVPFGFANLGFGNSTDANPSPWRAGANENTTITFSHDVLIEGKNLAAGTYGFFIAPTEGDKPWVLIFSKTSTAWGSFFYDKKDDALRVEVKPEKNAYHEWLSYEFTDRELASCTAQLVWEDLAIPFKISVNNMTQLYIEKMRQELQNAQGFDYTAWVGAANYCVENNVNLDEALQWANYALADGFVGRKNFTTLSCKASVLALMGRKQASDSIMHIAINDPTAAVMDIHFYARGLQQQGRVKEALEAFKINAQKHPNEWPVNLGLARGYSGTGDYKNALKYIKIALTQAPDPVSKKTCEDGIIKLQNNTDFN